LEFILVLVSFFVCLMFALSLLKVADNVFGLGDVVIFTIPHLRD